MSDYHAAHAGRFASALASLAGRAVWIVDLSARHVRLCLTDAGGRVLGGARMQVFGPWTLQDPSGAVVDRSCPIGQRENFELWRLCQPHDAGGAVASVTYREEGVPTLTLRTQSGWQLELYGDDDGYPDWYCETRDPAVTLVCNGRL